MATALRRRGERTTDIVPGEVIVKFKPSLSTQALGTLNVNGLQLERVRTLSATSARLYRAAGVSEQATLQLVATLAARPDVVYAQPNYRLGCVPNLTLLANYLFRL